MHANAQESLLQNPKGRQHQLLHGKWHVIVDPYETGFYDYRYVAFDQVKTLDPNYGGIYKDKKPTDKGGRDAKGGIIEYSFDKSPTLWVPGDWNSQDEKLFYYEGTIWYRNVFNYKKTANDNRVFVYFGAINYKADVYLNGTKLGTHIGGFTPFNFEITHLLKDSLNSLIVKVDNKRYLEAVPTLNTDWWNYGGITREVMLVETPATYIENYKIQLKKGSTTKLQASVTTYGLKAGSKVAINIPEAKISISALVQDNGIATAEVETKGLSLWSTESPKLYNIRVEAGSEKITDRIGFRSIEVKGTEIVLNGKNQFLRGICIHEENPLEGGRAWSEDDARLLLGWAKELNCNYVRLAHYPHSENMIRIAEEMGILVWEEIPVYWTIQWSNPQTLENAKKQLTEIILRDQNRANIIIWSMANETPVSPERDVFLTELIKTARGLDDTRLISCAMEKEAKIDNPLIQIVHDPLASLVDVVSFNQYVGWYDGTPEKCQRVNWEIPYDKPVIISEFGGGSLAGFYADSLTLWSEDYIESLYRNTIPMIKKIPQLRGVTPWILVDFRSPKRLMPNIQDGWNRKGLVSEIGTKKKAFWVLKAYYDEMEKLYK